MSKPPRCKICGVEHWGAEHVFSKRDARPFVVATDAVTATLVPDLVARIVSEGNAKLADVSRETFDWAAREAALGLAPLAERRL